MKSIDSELSIQYLILNDKNAKGEKLDEDHQFPYWSCLELYYDSIEEQLYEEEDDMKEYRETLFFYSREHFTKLVKSIPYMLIERFFFCSCCNKFDNKSLYNFNAPGTVTYFSCYNAKCVFKNADE